MKKVLSFVLSVAMVICLMPSLAFAADDAATTATATGLSQFSDADSIQNKEAVAVLVGLGIVDGMGDGTFQPKGDLTRAQASKLVSVLVKSGDKTELPAPATDPFTDVAKSHWGAGAIKFGVDNGYINGMGDGTFHPDDQVTTAQLATMLDKLLGYSVADINYQWPENAMAKATISGLLKGVTKGAGDVLNREEAAQIIFNALEANTRVKSTTTGSDTSLVDGGSSYADVPNNESDDYRTTGKDAVEQLIEKYFPKAVYDNDADRDGDAFKRPATVWKSGRTKITDELTKEPVLTYTARQVSSSKPTEKANDKVYNDLDGYGVFTWTKYNEEKKINEEFKGTPIYVNGERQEFNTDTKDYVFSNSDTLADFIATEYTGNGKLVEVYANDKDTQITRIVVADYYLVKVTRVDSKTGEISLENDNSIVKKDSFYSAVSSVARDDYILVAENSDKIVDAYIPEAKSGNAISKYSVETKPGREDATATIGEVYTWSHRGVGADGLKVNANDKGTALLDKYGYLVGYVRAHETAADWALLKAVYTVDETNEFGEPSTDYFGLIVKEDASIERVPLFYITNKKDPNYNTDANSRTHGIVDPIVDQLKTSDNSSTVVQNGKHNWFLTSGQLVTYKETAAGYKLSTVDVDINNTTLSAGVSDSTVKLDKDTTILGGYYLSSDLSLVTVSDEDNKASSVSASKASKITKTIDPSDAAKPISYKYVYKKIGNNTLVTTIFVTGKTDNSISMKVTRYIGPSTYGTGDARGYDIEYYTDGSSEVQTGTISEESGRPVKGAWYTTDEIKEGMTINPLATSKYVDVDVKYDPLNDTTAYGVSMTIDDNNPNTPDNFELTSDATVVDLDDVGIETAEDLVAEIAKITAESGNDPIHISFTWKEEGDKLVVKQVYINEVPKATTPSGQNGQNQQGDNQQTGDNTQQGDNQQTGDDTQQGDNQQTGDNTQQGDNQQTGDDTQQGGGGTVAG